MFYGLPLLIGVPHPQTRVKRLECLWAPTTDKIHVLKIADFGLPQFIQHGTMCFNIEISQLEYPEQLFYQELVYLSCRWLSSCTLKKKTIVFGIRVATNDDFIKGL